MIRASRAHVQVLGFAIVFVLGGCASKEEPDARPTETELRAEALLVEGRPRQALELFEKAAFAEGRSYLSHLGIARCHLRFGSPEAFERHAFLAASLAPRNPRAWRRVGSLFVQAGERFRSVGGSKQYAGMGVELLRRVFATNPSDDEVVMLLGVGLLRVDDPSSAAVMLEEAWRRRPGSGEAALYLLRALRRLGSTERAAEVLAEARERGVLPEDAGGVGVEDWLRSDEAGAEERTAGRRPALRPPS